MRKYLVMVLMVFAGVFSRTAPGPEGDQPATYRVEMDGLPAGTELVATL